MRFKKTILAFTIGAVLFVNLFLGLSRLGNYSAVDEPYWTYGRISKFWNAVENHKWKSTSVNDKPGITVAIVSGFGLLKIDPMPYESLRGDAKTESQLKDINTINFFFRLPIFLFCISLLPFFYFFLKKLFDETTAIFGFLFIGLSPILLGISLIINPDSLLWIFLPLSLLAYLIFQKDNFANKKYLYVSSFFLGLSLLTKYVSNILYIFFFLLPFLDYVLTEKKPALTQYIKEAAKNYLIIAGISMLTFFILYPAAWVNLNILLKGTFLSQAFETTWPIFVGAIVIIAFDILVFKNKATHWILGIVSKYRSFLVRGLTLIFLVFITLTITNTYSGMKLLNFESILASPKGIGEGFFPVRFLSVVLADIYSLIFAISPLALFSIIVALVFNLKKTESYSVQARTTFYFTIFILFYYFASTVNEVAATVRYQIAVFPLALIISAIGLSQFVKLEKIKTKVSFALVVLATGIILLASLFSIKPFYFAYASELLPQKYQVNLKDMGDGSYEAADYLNSLPNAEKLTIWSDKGAVCAVFKGECIIGFNKKELAKTKFDYVVVSSGRKSRTLKLSRSANDYIDFTKAYSSEQTVHSIIIGDRPDNYVKIFKASDLPGN